MTANIARDRQIRSFKKLGDAIDVPNLTRLQRDGYERFLQRTKKSSERDPLIGLESLLREIFPIESYDGTMRLEYISYELDDPRYTADECRELRLSYAMPFRVRIRLLRENHPGLPEEDIFLGEFPLMIGGGEFIVNGAERVIVSQLHRSPGVDFSIVSSEGDRPLHSTRIIPERGSWIEVEVTKKTRWRCGSINRPNLLRPLSCAVWRVSPQSGSILMSTRLKMAR